MRVSKRSLLYLYISKELNASINVSKNLEQNIVGDNLATKVKNSNVMIG